MKTYTLLALIGLSMLTPSLLAQTKAPVTSPSDRLQQLTSQLQKSPNDEVLRTKIIALALTLNTRPRTPDAASILLLSAEAAYKSGTSSSDFAAAAQKWERALLLAPWLTNDNYNCGMAHEKAGENEAAIRCFRRYLLAAPHAVDAAAVKQRIDGLQPPVRPTPQLQELIAQLQKSPDDALRGKVIALALAQRPTPATPDAAIMAEGGAEFVTNTALEHLNKAKDQEERSAAAREFSIAAKEWEKTVLLAPWVAKYYYNCGEAHQYADENSEAIRCFQLFLLAAPDADKAEEVKKRIGRLQYVAKQAQEVADEQVRIAAQHAKEAKDAADEQARVAAQQAKDAAQRATDAAAEEAREAPLRAKEAEQRAAAYQGLDGGVWELVSYSSVFLEGSIWAGRDVSGPIVGPGFGVGRTYIVARNLQMIEYDLTGTSHGLIDPRKPMKYNDPNPALRSEHWNVKFSSRKFDIEVGSTNPDSYGGRSTGISHTVTISADGETISEESVVHQTGSYPSGKIDATTRYKGEYKRLRLK